MGVLRSELGVRFGFEVLSYMVKGINLLFCLENIFKFDIKLIDFY